MPEVAPGYAAGSLPDDELRVKLAYARQTSAELERCREWLDELAEAIEQRIRQQNASVLAGLDAEIAALPVVVPS